MFKQDKIKLIHKDEIYYSVMWQLSTYFYVLLYYMYMPCSCFGDYGNGGVCMVTF